MNRIAGMIMMAAAGTAGWAGEIQPVGPDRAVTVCMERNADPQLVPLALFATAGVRIDWRETRGCPPAAIFISLSADPHNRQHPGSLAYALPFEGIHIMIFVDRVAKVIDPRGVPYVMAHVLVHEVTHILQGVSRHSASGVMKAKWTAVDYYQMYSKPLRFTAEDIELLQRGVDERNGRLAPRR